MAPKNIEYIAELIESEPHSPDYDSRFSHLLEVDAGVHKIYAKINEMSKKYNLSPEKIYKAIDVDSVKLFEEGLVDPDAWEFHYSDVTQDLKDLEEQLIPLEDAKYGGSKKVAKMGLIPAAMAVLLPDSRMKVLYPEKPTTDTGATKDGELILKKKKNIFDDVIVFVGKHPVASVATAITLYFAGGAVLDYANKDDQKAGNTPIKTVSTVVSADIAQNQLSQDNGIAGNASDATATPTPELPQKPLKRYYLLYSNGNASTNDITIIGDSPQFIEDVVISLEYLGQFSPEYKLTCTKEIEEDWVHRIPEMASSFGGTTVNASDLHKMIELKSLASNGAGFKNEDQHSCDGPNNISEANAEAAGSPVWDKLIAVPKPERDKFIREFDFSKYRDKIEFK